MQTPPPFSEFTEIIIHQLSLCSAQQQQAKFFNPIPVNGWYNVKSIQQLLYVVYIVAFVTVLYIKTLTDLVFSLTDCAFLTEINIICTLLIKHSVTSSIIITARFSIKLFHLFFTTEYILLTPLLNHWMPAESKLKKKLNTSKYLIKVY